MRWRNRGNGRGSAGAAEAGGLVIGVRPDTDREAICDGLSAVLYTNMGAARNAVVAEQNPCCREVRHQWGAGATTCSEYRDIPLQVR
ncbi:hypothetical protein AB0B25_06900 [Nocardia sp. NPDC049190]|uniref:SLOG cluster 4 domain-containing protein n=1 Tax=Nocardia sp. NPDC049190 TaxID=3155650 RepID=UPI0033F2130C